MRESGKIPSLNAWLNRIVSGFTIEIAAIRRKNEEISSQPLAWDFERDWITLKISDGHVGSKNIDGVTDLLKKVLNSLMLLIENFLAKFFPILLKY